MRRPKLGTIDSVGVRIANRTAVLQKLFFLGAVLFSVGVVTAATFELVGTEWGFAGETSKSAGFGRTARSAAIQAATALPAPTPRKTTR
jgi:hypothetical protein